MPRFFPRPPPDGASARYFPVRVSIAGFGLIYAIAMAMALDPANAQESYHVRGAMLIAGFVVLPLYAISLTAESFPRATLWTLTVATTSLLLGCLIAAVLLGPGVERSFAIVTAAYALLVQVPTARLLRQATREARQPPRDPV